MNLGFLNVQSDPVDALQDKKLSKADVKAMKLQQLRELAQSFESIFLNMLTKSMRSTVKKSGFMSGGQGEEMFTNLLDMRLSEDGAKRGRGMGIANMIVKRYGKHLRTPESDKGSQMDVKK